jgi:hypothetical protein
MAVNAGAFLILTLKIVMRDYKKKCQGVSPIHSAQGLQKLPGKNSRHCAEVQMLTYRSHPERFHIHRFPYFLGDVGLILFPGVKRFFGFKLQDHN